MDKIGKEFAESVFISLRTDSERHKEKILEILLSKIPRVPDLERMVRTFECLGIMENIVPEKKEKLCISLFGLLNSDRESKKCPVSAEEAKRYYAESILSILYEEVKHCIDVKDVYEKVGKSVA